MKIAVIGSTGQLGTDLMKTFKHGHEVVGLTHQDIEVTDHNSCILLKEHRPDVIINTAAFHKIGQCEEEPMKAFAVNALGARNVAAISREIGATATLLVQTTFSTAPRTSHTRKVTHQFPSTRMEYQNWRANTIRNITRNITSLD